MPKTVVVLGVARSGTSILSGIIHHLGIKVWHNNSPQDDNPNGTYETPDFVQHSGEVAFAIDKGKLPGDIDMAINLTRWGEGLVAKYNFFAEGADWGWKSALTHWCLEQYYPRLIDPHFLVIRRNVISTAASWAVHAKRTYNWDYTVEQAILKMQPDRDRLDECVASIARHPVMEFTYEWIMDNINAIPGEIASFLGLQPTDEQLSAAIAHIIPAPVRV